MHARTVTIVSAALMAALASVFLVTKSTANRAAQDGLKGDRLDHIERAEEVITEIAQLSRNLRPPIDS